jgi:hypothetical protein
MSELNRFRQNMAVQTMIGCRLFDRLLLCLHRNKQCIFIELICWFFMHNMLLNCLADAVAVGDSWNNSFALKYASSICQNCELKLQHA